MTYNNINEVYGIIERLIGPSLSHNFILYYMDKDNGRDVFEIESENDKVIIRGSSGVAIASGFNWYLKYYCKAHFSWCGTQLAIKELPSAPEKVRIISPYPYRYYLNYCTYGYSMLFWDWKRWEKEIDWMALNGINLVLSINGQEEVWRRTLLRLGYSDSECKEFLCGPAFLPWQWMQNMTSWGGPLPDSWFENNVALAKKIHERMLSLGISPVLHGYSGAVPVDFKLRFPEVKLIDQGRWNSFRRPSLLCADSPMFDYVASIFYEEQRKLFGSDIHFYSTDLFHEGGKTCGIDITKCTRIIHEKMLQEDSNAVWVIQAWQNNPREELIDGLIKNNALILDLCCESTPEWKKRNGFYGVPWIWCIVHNFGGTLGLYGNLEKIANDPLSALKDSDSMSGIGIMMEGIETNPVVYELMTEMAWRSEKPDLDIWIKEYIERRYGKLAPDAEKAWGLLKDSVYNCQVAQQGGVESIICARPDAVIKSVSTWGPKEVYYDRGMVRQACRLLYKCYDELSGSDAYLFDLVDVTRQALADLARDYHKDLMEAFSQKDKSRLEITGNKFLKLIIDQDKLLGTRKEFLLGNWIERARNAGETENEKRLYEFNARTLITLWGDKEASRELHEYSHREWSGLISDFYYHRWRIYIESLKAALINNTEPKNIDWYSLEYNWTRKTNDFETLPKGDIYEIVGDIVSVYLN